MRAAGAELRGIIKKHRCGDQERRGGSHTKSEGRPRSPWVPRAGRGHRGSRASGQLAGLLAPPGGPRAGLLGWAYLTLPPAAGKEKLPPPTGRCDASRRRKPMGAETLGRTANRGSGGAGKGGSPASPLEFKSSLGSPGVGKAGGGRRCRKWLW